MLWKKPFQKHCSDELLLSHVDGELSFATESVVRKHLKACWECRATLAELEEQAQAVAKTLAEPLFPGVERIGEARRRFSVWERRFEQSLETGPKLQLRATSSVHLRAVATAGVLCLAIAGIWFPYYLRNPRAAEVLAATQKVEREIYQAPLLHQSFRVEISEKKPEMRRRTGRLEVWSEAGGARFTSRWRDDDGTLRHALWKPERNREYVFSPAMAPGVIPVAEQRTEMRSLVQISGGEVGLEQIEGGFARWLQARRWRPIALASELSVFVDENGVMLRAERVRSAEGESAIRLSAQRTYARFRVEIVMDVDALTYRPRLQRILFEADGREVEVYLAVERAESVPPQRLTATVFQPDAALIAPGMRTAVARSTKTVPPQPPAVVVVTQPDPADLEAVEIEAHYALHRALACLGEPIEIVRHPSGYLQVRGLAATAERKTKLLASLAQVTTPSWLQVDIQTVEEVSAKQPREAVPSPRETHTFAAHLPIQDQLEHFFSARGDSNSSDRRRQIIELANEAVSSSDGALVHTWALRRLAERYGGNRAARLRPQSRRLLEAMLRDHLVALRARSDRTRQLLEPALVLAPSGSKPAAAEEVLSDLNWSDATLAVFDTIRGMDGLVQALVAGADLNGKPVELAAGELQRAFARLESNVRALDAALGREFRLEILEAQRHK